MHGFFFIFVPSFAWWELNNKNLKHSAVQKYHCRHLHLWLYGLVNYDTKIFTTNTMNVPIRYKPNTSSHLSADYISQHFLRGKESGLLFFSRAESACLSPCLKGNCENYFCYLSCTTILKNSTKLGLKYRMTTNISVLIICARKNRSLLQ